MHISGHARLFIHQPPARQPTGKVNGRPDDAFVVHEIGARPERRNLRRNDGRVFAAIDHDQESTDPYEQPRVSGPRKMEEVPVETPDPASQDVAAKPFGPADPSIFELIDHILTTALDDV